MALQGIQENLSIFPRAWDIPESCGWIFLRKQGDL